MLTIYDYGIIIFYLVFMLAVGWVFRRMNQNSSDYFRGHDVDCGYRVEQKFRILHQKLLRSLFS